MTTTSRNGHMETGVRNLDALFHGGLPKGSVTVLGGPPGSGKTTLAQQICFHNASADRPVLYFNTLSEPTAKTLRYLNQFSFFDAAKFDAGIQFVDLGGTLRTTGLDEISKLIMDQIKKTKPALVVIDSFKVFDDLAKSRDDLRKFVYELTVGLMAWETTTLLLGEYELAAFQTNPLFSIVDGIIAVTQAEQSGEQQRFIQVIKMRGAAHSRDEHSFLISREGIAVFAPRVTIQREDSGPGVDRCKIGVSKLDELLGDGVPRGSSLLISGVAGTGKTVLLLEFIYRGALQGEKGIVFSFEETDERLRAAARGMGWNFDEQIDRGMIKIIFTPQPNIMVEEHLLMMREDVEAFKAQRVAVDSVSVFLYKIKEPQSAREKVFQLASVIQNTQAVGFFATDIPYGLNQLSRFGVEETVVDGVILLSLTAEGLERQRYLEVYKLRNTAHLKGRHNMTIGPGGITVFPRYTVDGGVADPIPPIETGRRLPSGVAGLDELMGGGLLAHSVTLVSGSAGIGKSTFGLQFITEGVRHQEPGLYVSLEEGPAQLMKVAEVLELPLPGAVDTGVAEMMYLSRAHVRASQFLAILVDKVREKNIQRLVLDGVSNIAVDGEIPEELRQLLFALMTRLKALGVTTVLTLESKSMHSTDVITDHGFSAIADNVVMLRYVEAPGESRSSLSVIKTRGSAHDWSSHYYTITKGGIRIGDRVGGPAKLSAGKKTTTKKTS